MTPYDVLARDHAVLMTIQLLPVNRTSNRPIITGTIAIVVVAAAAAAAAIS